MTATTASVLAVAAPPFPQRLLQLREPDRTSMRGIILLLLILTGTLWFWSLTRANLLFRVKIREGRVSFARGRIPPELLADIADIVARAGVIRAEIRGVVSDGAPRLLFRGEMSPGAQQQLRNVVATYSVSQLRHSKRR